MRLTIRLRTLSCGKGCQHAPRNPKAQGTISLTKLGETRLFGSLGLALLLASVAASPLHGG